MGGTSDVYKSQQTLANFLSGGLESTPEPLEVKGDWPIGTARCITIVLTMIGPFV